MSCYICSPVNAGIFILENRDKNATFLIKMSKRLNLVVQLCNVGTTVKMSCYLNQGTHFGIIKTPDHHRLSHFFVRVTCHNCHLTVAILHFSDFVLNNSGSPEIYPCYHYIMIWRQQRTLPTLGPCLGRRACVV